MSYTHYWTHRRRFTNAEWLEICLDIARITAYSEVPIEADPFFPGGVHIEGVGEDALETFCLYKNRPLEFNDKGWDFCKTGRKPYDVIVTAVLCYLESCYAKNFSVGSDGDVADWEAGLALARAALPEKGNILDVPFEIRWEEQWENIRLRGFNYAIGRHKNGRLYVTKGYEIFGYLPSEEEDRALSRVKKAIPTGWMKMGEREKKIDRAIRNLLTYPEFKNDPVV